MFGCVMLEFLEKMRIHWTRIVLLWLVAAAGLFGLIAIPLMLDRVLVNLFAWYAITAVFLVIPFLLTWYALPGRTIK